MRYDQTNAECLVFTFKEGLLSPVAHDLRLRVTRFTLELDEARTQVVARFDTGALEVDTPMKDGAPNPNALSAEDKRKIASQIRDDVLHSTLYPTAEFRSSSLVARDDGGYDVRGELTLHGATRQVSAKSVLEAGKQLVELTLHQPDFGIAPFRAMLGTLKIKSDVIVRLSL
jgi:hypothetical protein